MIHEIDAFLRLSSKIGQSSTIGGKTRHGQLTQDNRTLLCKCSRILFYSVYVPVYWHWINV